MAPVATEGHDATGRAARLLALVACLGLAGGRAAAEERTNRDRSQYTEIRDGGFPIRSGLRVVSAAEARLADSELVIGVVIGNERRAYPVNLMWEPQNEALNDELGGVPITATWCPIAHSASVFERTVAARPLDLGTLGIDRGVFQLYDPQTRTTWSQVSGAASRGPLQGRMLAKRETLLTTWSTWRRLHPATTVFVDPALPNRRVFTAESLARITQAADGPLRNEDLVVGVVSAAGTARAWLLRATGGAASLAGAAAVLNDSVGQEPVLVWMADDAVTVRVLRRAIGDRVLSFVADGAGVRDRETGTVWEPLTGRALAGPLAGRSLEPFVATTALWYAWRHEQPSTTVWTGPDPAR